MSQRIPPDNLAYAVLLSINEGKSLGSGFRLKAKNGCNYLITARHVLFDAHDKIYGDTLLITCHSPNREESSPSTLQVDLSKAKIFDDGKTDVAAILLGHNKPVDGHDHKTSLKKLKSPIKRLTALHLEEYVQLLQPGSGNAISVDFEAVGKLSLVSITSDVYLLGYPTSLGLQHSRYYDFTKPLVRKGIVAGVDEKKSTFIIDCSAYPGNSGGPVVEHCMDGYFRVTGVVSKYIPYEIKWHSNRKDIINTEIHNSGYTVCISMDAVFSLINDAI